jgi:hypothetical protein
MRGFFDAETFLGQHTAALEAFMIPLGHLHVTFPFSSYNANEAIP